MPRVRSQLALQLPPELIQSIKATAASGGQTVTTMVRGWLEAGLSGALVAPTAAGAGADPQARVEALEKAVAELQSPRPTAAAAGRAQKPRPEPAADPPIEPAPTPHAGDAPAGGITTAELAERTGTNRAAWNNWARDKNPEALARGACLIAVQFNAHKINACAVKTIVRPAGASLVAALGFLVAACGSDPCLNTDYMVVGQIAGPGSGTKFLTVPTGATDEQIKAVASSACGSRFCRLLIWEDSKPPARSLPLTEEQAASQLASYVHNPNTGSESLIIRGQDVPTGSCSNR